MVDDVLKVGVLLSEVCNIIPILKVNKRGMNNITFKYEVCLSVIFVSSQSVVLHIKRD